MENAAKVGAKIVDLQKQTGHKWVHVNGFNAVTGFDYGTGQGANFNPGFGLPVKIFIDTVTGEVKLFSADLFKD